MKGVLACLLGLLGLLVVPDASARPQADRAVTGERVLRLGKISDDPQRDLTGLRPFLDYVAEELAVIGITAVDVIMAREAAQMVSYLRQGRVDWVTETSGMGVILEGRTGARIVLNRWKYGEREYRATIFTRRDSPIASIEDLAGRTIAFEHAGSTTGFLAPALDLHRAGLELVLMATPRDRPPPHMVGYLFSGDEINTSMWVHKGLADLGALSSTDWSRAFQVPDAFVDELRIIHEGEPLPRAVELFRADLDVAVADRLMEVLINASESERGRAAMNNFQGTTRFERFRVENWPYMELLRQGLSPALEAIR